MKIKDRILLGIIAGTLGNAAKNISDEILNMGGFGRGSYRQLATELVAGKKYNKTKKGAVAGVITDSIIGAGLGVPIVYLLSKSGKDYYGLKGAGVGSLEWLVTIGLIGSVSKGLRTAFPLGPESAISSIWNHMLYGMVTAYAAVKLGHPELFKEERPEAKVRTGAGMSRTTGQTVGEADPVIPSEGGHAARGVSSDSR